MNPRVALGSFFLLLVFVTPGLAAFQTQGFLSGSPCPSQESKFLSQWGTDLEAKPIEPSPGKGIPLSVLAPTREIGTWVILKRDPQGTWLSMREVTALQSTEYRFRSGGCSPEPKIKRLRQPDEKLKGAFTDAELKRLVETRKPGLIYSWSPNMPYSVLGISEIQRVARDLKLQLSIVRDPDADSEMSVRDLKRSRSRCDDCTRPIEALDLLYRNMDQHFPTLLVYSGGKIDPLVFPGYGSYVGYRRFVEARLKK
jgi:hypothetical protein